jgi:hypothetical protein
MMYDDPNDAAEHGYDVGYREGLAEGKQSTDAYQAGLNAGRARREADERKLADMSAAAARYEAALRLYADEARWKEGRGPADMHGFDYCEWPWEPARDALEGRDPDVPELAAQEHAE